MLVADDDPLSRQVLIDTLKDAGYEVTAVANGKDALDLLSAEDGPRLAILDWMMPGMSGPDVCRNIRGRGVEPYRYLILLTANDQRDQVVAGLEAGADDYLIKPFNPAELRARLRTGERILQMQHALIETREALRIQATHDPGTGLWNRRAILELLARELARARREGQPVAVIMLDLDHFKEINDNFGHLAGDAALLEAGRRMLQVLRPYDAVGRYGGDEFLVISPSCDLARATSLAQRLHSALTESPIHLREGIVHLTASIGVAAAQKEDESEVDALIRAADEALYRAKRAGRNRVEPSP